MKKLIGAVTMLLLVAAAGATPALADHDAAHERLVVTPTAKDCDTYQVSIEPKDLGEFIYRIQINGSTVWQGSQVSVVVVDLDAGDYTAELQVQQPGGGWVAATGSGGAKWHPSVSFTLAAKCNGSITVDKNVPGADGTNFTIDFDPGSDITIDDNDAPVVRSDLAPGTYRLREEPVAGYRLDVIECSSNLSGADIDIEGAEVTIVLRAGEHVICTFYNQKVVPTPTPTPTATATSVPTSTPTPEPTSAPLQPVIIVPTAPPPQVVTVEVPRLVEVQAPRISPPSTGDAGIAETSEKPWLPLAGLGFVAAGGLALVTRRLARS